MASIMREAGALSVVDFGKFLDGTHKQQVADAIIQSFKDIGFVYLVNHGLPQDKIDAMFGWVRPSLVNLHPC